MAIQVRRGLHLNMDPNKLLPGEFAVSTDRQVIHIAFSPGVVKRLSTYEDMKADMQESLEEIINSLTVSINQATTNANSKANLAEQKAMLADAKAILADQKAQEAQAIIDATAPIINQNLQATYSDKAIDMIGTTITISTADNGLVEITKIDGGTQIIKSDPLLEVSPDNPCTFNYAENFKLRSTTTPHIPSMEDEIDILFQFVSMPNGVKNTIEIIDGVWTKVERVRAIVLNGSRSWGSNYVNDITLYRATTQINGIGDVDTNKLICNRLQVYPTPFNMDITLECIAISTNNLNVIIKKTRLGTQNLAGFIAWVTANPIIIQYELPAPIYTPIEPLYLKSYKGITNVSTTSNPQVTMTANFKSELWARDYLQDDLIKSKFDANSGIAFTEATTDTDVVSGDTIPTLWGKVLKRFNSIKSSLNGKINTSDIVNNDTTGGTTKVASAETVKVLGQEIDTLNNNLDSKSNKGDIYINVRDFGAKGDRTTNDTNAIQAAIDSIRPTSWDVVNGQKGGVVFFPSGTYRISSTLRLPAYVTLQGSGMLSTELFLSNGSNVDVIKTDKYDELVGSGLSYYDTSGVPVAFGIRDMTVRGNHYNNTSGGGIKIYGYGYNINNLQIIESAGTAFVSRREIGNDTWVVNKTKLTECTIRGLYMRNCKSRGIDWYGPTDARIESAFVADCEGDVGVAIRTSVDVGLLHVYGCNINGGVGLLVEAGARFDSVISESNFNVGIRINTWLASFRNIQSYTNGRNTPDYNIILTSESNMVNIDNIEIRIGSIDGNGISINGTNHQIGNVTVYADSSVERINKKGVDIRGTAKNLRIANCYVNGFTSEGGTGIAFSQGGLGEISINATVENCKTCYNRGSGTSGGNKMNLVALQKNENQIALSSTYTPPTTDDIKLMQKSVLGVWSKIL